MKTMFALMAMTGLAIATNVSAQQAMDPHMAGMEHAAQPADAQGVGVIKAVDTTKGTVTLQHEAISAMGWPAMTMVFKVASPDLLSAAKVGDRVHFGLRPSGMGGTVTSIMPAN
ncbi:copper-binding protein [Luteibacter rhizovicinus DSM 16549]|uniref:Copper-binding protein n=1 Tax=Luteibacter rhizovicinus DSM 16549 TaxID=1440763 RepID=A0A0G9H900_9GAMM|nr:copper-binding protein [Luteibacter rhizovicinus]APG04260.1 copper-binding protein [Luteibacter rhizovicinus DSM 16549]KLD66103.1 copper-binding protein [Luteibacter rhizovicinus DSM 16549]KLD80034.1 copper-binding protein [Xanthomonas hyacinthi DSM 19077]